MFGSFFRRHGSRGRSAPNLGRVLRAKLSVENLEKRELLSSGFRSIDGTGNNLANPDWGSAGINFLRTAPAGYADGISAPTVGSPARPSAREISNVLVDQGAEDVISRQRLSAMIYAWGQFLDHDLDLTGSASPAELFDIQVPAGDPHFDPMGTGTQIIPLSRSGYDPRTGTSPDNPRQQINLITAWIDGSMIYGSDAEVARKLRTGVGGRLKTSPGDLLPFNNDEYFPDGPVPMANGGRPGEEMFAAGDVRTNENVELTSLHTLFLREHNRIADRIQKQNPLLDDEEIYQRARAWVGAEIQVISYREWLPALLGPGALRPYAGYNPDVNPGIANEFAAALFRLGHSLLGDDVEFLDNDGREVAEEIPLFEAFFNPDVIHENGIASILKYLASDPSSELDNTIVNSVRNFLFGPPGAGGFDLASLNIQRGRDHGLADYNTMREAYGLPRVMRFDQITRNPEIGRKLHELYGNVNNIDPWVGALAEDHLPGSSTGPLIRRVLADQFERLRAGDRFWYRLTYSGSELQELEQTTLADVIRRNTETTNLQENVFFFRVEIGGTVFHDMNRNGRLDPGEPGLGGRLVELLDPESGDRIATARTDMRGRYSFDVGDDLGLGEYRVRELVPGGWRQTSRDPGDITFTRGEQFARNVNFGNVRSGPGPGGDTGGRFAFWAADLAEALSTDPLRKAPGRIG